MRAIAKPPLLQFHLAIIPSRTILRVSRVRAPIDRHAQR
jgi:hypothetical protein